MLDTLVVGGGLCGLSLASKLQFAGREYLLVEARGRLGGRIETVPGSAESVPADLGPTWFWPETQPRITRLIADLGLQSFAQHDAGTILHLSKGDGSPENLAQAGVHNAAHRVVGGMGAVVDALTQRLSVERIRLGYELTKLVGHARYIEAHCWTGTETVVISARNVVLALPPRLLEERVVFEPKLPESLRHALADTPTWMAAQCKAVSRFATPFWRAAGLAGNAFVTHHQAVLGEIFDACSADGTQAALGGFSALPPSVRTAFKAVHDMMIHSQFAQLFGPAADSGELFVRDWANERFTCSARDAQEPGAHPEDAVPAFASSYWADKLYFAGSETASVGAGYLEGALDAAARVWARIAQQFALANAARNRELLEMNARNESSLQVFHDAVNSLRTQALGLYRQGLTRRLAVQQSEDMTQKTLVEVVETIYTEALLSLRDLALDMRDLEVVQGRTELTPAVLSAFIGFSDALLTEVQKYNATSCAISNFPLEHKLDSAYLQVIRRDLAAAWRAFALSANEVLLDKMSTVPTR